VESHIKLEAGNSSKCAKKERKKEKKGLKEHGSWVDKYLNAGKVLAHP